MMGFTDLVVAVGNNSHRHLRRNKQYLLNRQLQHQLLLSQELQNQLQLLLDLRHLQTCLQVFLIFRLVFVSLQLTLFDKRQVLLSIILRAVLVTEMKIIEQTNKGLSSSLNVILLMLHRKLNSGQFFGHLLMQLSAAVEWPTQQNF